MARGLVTRTLNAFLWSSFVLYDQSTRVWGLCCHVSVGSTAEGRSCCHTASSHLLFLFRGYHLPSFNRSGRGALQSDKVV